MSSLKKSIFRQYDIRGIFGVELTEKDGELIGKAFGTMVLELGENWVIVGRDNRKSSPILHRHVVTGLLSTGVNVLDIGVVVSPIFYYATHLYKVPSGLMITASHNPAPYNGLKIQLGGHTIYGNALQVLRERANDGIFTQGTGIVDYRSPVRDYTEMIKSKVNLGQKKIKVVVDCGNGTAGAFAPMILKELGCEVIPLYCDSNPDFPHHFPDPVRPENLVDLIKAVRTTQADLGLGFDGDGDRLGVVDEQGNIIWGDMLMILFWREILPKYPGTPGIVEVKCSDLLVKEIAKLGGKPVFYKTGHSLIKAKMRELKAVFTGEMSGHMFFADEYFGYDDAIYAAARLLRIIAESGRYLSRLLSDLPQTFSTPELRIPCSEKEKGFYVAQAKKYFVSKGLEIIDVDGVRAIFPRGWGLVRASNTGPELIVRCEGETPDELEKIKAEIAKSIVPLSMKE
ncbi:MAG: phosphomannomutase/phosphoglucomutase [Bacillota bacterium]|jgi:phosphomannomutase/phosphoglucomutase